MAEQLRLTKPDAPEPPSFVRTETAANILLSVDFIRTRPRAAATMVCGVPGCGKSTTLEMLAETDPASRLISVAPGEGGSFGIAEIIINKLGLGIKPKGCTIAELRDKIGKHLNHAGIWLMVDEAQNLTKAGADWLRILCEENRTDLLLAGDLGLARMVDGMGQLRSRMRLPVIVDEVSKGDVEAVAQGFGVSAAKSLKMLHRAALMPGGLRNVDAVLSMASDAGDGEITPELIAGTIMALRLFNCEGELQ